MNHHLSYTIGSTAVDYRSCAAELRAAADRCIEIAARMEARNLDNVLARSPEFGNPDRYATCDCDMGEVHSSHCDR